MTRLGGIRRTKYGAVRVWSNLCNRSFDSKAEALYGENLYMLQMGEIIEDLQYQKTFVLSESPKVTITIDFVYFDKRDKAVHYEDVKGVLTRDFRTKLAWLKEKYGIEIRLKR